MTWFDSIFSLDADLDAAKMCFPRIRGEVTRVRARDLRRVGLGRAKAIARKSAGPGAAAPGPFGSAV